MNLSTLMGGVFTDRTFFCEKKEGLFSETSVILRNIESKIEIFGQSWTYFATLKHFSIDLICYK